MGAVGRTTLQPGNLRLLNIPLKPAEVSPSPCSQIKVFVKPGGAIISGAFIFKVGQPSLLSHESLVAHIPIIEVKRFVAKALILY